MHRRSTGWRTLAIDPTDAGAAYVVLEGATRLIHWGFLTLASQDPVVFRQRIAGLWERYQPALLVVERAETSLRGARAQQRLLLAEDVAGERSRSIIKVTRHQVQMHFAGRGTTRLAIAYALLEDFPELRSWRPIKPRLFERESRRMHLFAALAHAVTALAPLELA